MKCMTCNKEDDKLYSVTARPYMVTGGGCVMSVLVCETCLELYENIKDVEEQTELFYEMLSELKDIAQYYLETDGFVNNGLKSLIERAERIK